MLGGAPADLGQGSSPDGWFIPNPEEFAFLTEHAPPRPMSYAFIVLNDAKHWEPLLLWTLALVFIVLGMVTDLWLVAISGALALVHYGWGVTRVVRSLRHSLVVGGVIEQWDPRLAGGRFLTARARFPDGRTIGVGLHRRWATEVRGHGEPVEVLVLHSPGVQYSSIVGVRPISDPPD